MKRVNMVAICFLSWMYFIQSWKVLPLKASHRISFSALHSLKEEVSAGIFGKLESEFAKHPMHSSELKIILEDFLNDYVCSSTLCEKTSKALHTLVEEVIAESQTPFQFKPFHESIRQPFDFYAWGNDIFRPLINSKDSTLVGTENLKYIEELLEKGENVVFIANHQTEADPQAISILFENMGFGPLAERIVYIAGHKVITDPMAIPFSKGRNLICIHSKRHIQNPPEEFTRKQSENIASMKVFAALASKGGNIFWIAPSGGRDRPDASQGMNTFRVAPFDDKVIQMLLLIEAQSKKKLHFFPMAMCTNQLVPPPDELSSTIGEKRRVKYCKIHIKVGSEFAKQSAKELTNTAQATVEKAYLLLQENC